MDINDLRSFFTVVTVIMFAAIVWWAWSGRRKQAFDEAALLPLEDDPPIVEPQVSRTNERNAR